mgnify:FL=1
MRFNVDKIQEVHNSTSVTASAPEHDVQTFDYAMSAPADNFVSKQLWCDDTKAIVHNLVEKTGIASYKPSLLKDDNTAIAKSQTHLIDLMKYYEGDCYYYYEAITTPYKDKFGTWTNGFGELSDKLTTQEAAYKKLAANIESYAGEVENLLNRRIGKGTYDALPNSIKEALIDLNYNKGLSKISGNKVLMDALKNKDYSKVVANLAYVYSGKKGAEQVEDAGLYRRSLSRAILAVRDLKGSERKEAEKEVENLYNKAQKCYNASNIDTMELDKIYEQFSTGKISSEPVSSAAYKINVDSRFKGKGVMAVAQEAYKALGDTTIISWSDFYSEFKRINRNPETIKIGEQMNVPYIKNIQAVEEISEPAPEVKQEEEKTEEPKTEEKGFWGKLWDGVKGFFKAIGNFFVSLFSRKKSKEDTVVEEENKTTFQKMLETATVRQEGEFQIVTQDYEVKKGDSVWNLARTYATTEDIICADNGIEDKNKIKEGQIIKIQKLGYKVLQGDNLFQIAKKFGLTVEILKDLNNIEDVDKIQAGQMIEIPGFVYEVKPKDTLTKISQRVGVSVKDLMKINGLTSDAIKPEQKIIVVYNNSDYAVSADKKKVVVDKATNTRTEIVDMSSDAKLAARPLLKQKSRVNGQVVATRKVFEPKNSGKLSGKTIIINAGHGYSQAGTDPGALSPGGIDDEWLINYDNAMRLKDRLCAQGAKVIFLQGHVNLITKELAKNNNKADMFISVHVNSHDKPTSDRTQIYASTNKLSINKKSCELADMMEKKFDDWIPEHEKISKKDAFINKGKQDYAQSKQANYAVIREAEKVQKIPAVLWEIAFMVSPKGRERMSNPDIMNSYSDIMSKSIVEYFN